ncbi:MAG: hypothetical protein PHW43_10270, partial [Syntrophales bacterium]|nr:hypothetical protein [Syntrophales bacterium]
MSPWAVGPEPAEGSKVAFSPLPCVFSLWPFAFSLKKQKAMVTAPMAFRNYLFQILFPKNGGCVECTPEKSEQAQQIALFFINSSLPIRQTFTPCRIVHETYEKLKEKSNLFLG